MKHLLTILATFTIGSSTLSNVSAASFKTSSSNNNSNSELDTNGSKNDNNANSDEQSSKNGSEGTANSIPEFVPEKEKEPTIPQDKRTNLFEIIKETSYYNFKNVDENILLDTVLKKYPELKNEVEIKDFKMPDEEKQTNGSAIINAKDDSLKYKGKVYIYFSIDQYKNYNFNLDKYEETMRVGEQRTFKVTNFSSEWRNEDYPNNFEYNKDYFIVSFKKNIDSIVVTAKDKKIPPKFNCLEITVNSNIPRLNNKKTIKITLNAQKVDFQLETEKINILAQNGSKTDIGIINFDDLIDESNYVKKVEVSDETYLSANIDKNKRYISILANNNYIDKVIEVLVYSNDFIHKIKVTLICPPRKAKLNTNVIDINVNSEGFIKITNFNELYVEDNMPNVQSISDTNALSAELDKASQSIKIRTNNKPVEKVIIKIKSKNVQEVQEITVNVKGVAKDFSLESNEITLDYKQTKTIKVKNYDELYGLDINYPTLFKYNNKFIDVRFNSIAKSIEITAKTTEATNQTLEVSSKMGHKEVVSFTVRIPDIGFKLDNKNITMEYKETKRIKVTNLDEIYNADKNKPNQFLGYDNNAIDVIYDNKTNEIVITAKEKEVINGKITVQSVSGHIDEINYSVSIPNVEFKLEEKLISIDYYKETRLKVINLDQIYRVEKNLPKIFDYDNSVLKLSYDSSSNEIVIKAKNKEVNNGSFIVRSQSGFSKTINYSVSIPNVPFKLETNSVSLGVEQEKRIKITNHNDLYGAAKNFPTSQGLKYNKNVLDVSYDSKNFEIVIKTKKQEASGQIIVESDNHTEYINYNVTVQRVDFELDTNNVSLDVYKEARIKILNKDKLYSYSDKNLPLKYSGYNTDEINVSYDRNLNEIVIKAKGLKTQNKKLIISSQNGTQKTVTYNINVPRVDFDLGNVSNMSVGSSQSIDVKNWYSLLHSDNYPLSFSYSKNGIVSAKYDQYSHKIIIDSLSNNAFCRNFKLTVKSVNGTFKELVFDVVKQQDLNSTTKNLDYLNDLESNTIKEAFFNKNSEYGLDMNDFKGFGVKDITENSAIIYANDDITRRWFYGEAKVNYLSPKVVNYDIDTGWSELSYSNRNADNKEVKISVSNGKFDMSYDEFMNTYKSMEISYSIYYKYTSEYTGKWENNIKEEKREDKSITLDIKNYSNLKLVDEIDKTFIDDGDKDVVLFNFYMSSSFIKGSTSWWAIPTKDEYSFEFRATVHTDRPTASFFSANKVAALVGMKLNYIKFKR
ncbi:hypothetical protein [Spiroplasma tabanidicola]|uniref:Uncharacterized protein n=1 Tax=Spiroplasma tabanidicola TaxID=324079 RepID=A0A6I6CAU5_9MOLU|nr:hypothetical protein [Spiroplasma tabanidicola]QGS52045.1 hypothetical protein STABA_v1c06860 [Spiroplasma tabanidicola]